MPEDAVCARTISELREAAGEEGYARIRAEFLSSTERNLGEMARFADADDIEPLRRAAHALNGASGSLGAFALAARCRELEACIAAGASREARAAAVAGMAVEFAAVRRALGEAA